MSRPGVVCVGGAVVDLKYTLEAPAVLETSNPATASTSFGGVARNVAENLAGLGVPVQLVSRLGDDAAGSALREQLATAGVGVEHLRTRPGQTTAQYVAVLDPAGDLVLGVAAMDVLATITTADLDRAWPDAGGWVCCDANLGRDVLAHALHRARTGVVPLVLDAVSTPKVTRLPADLRGARLLSLNLDEARAYLTAHGRVADGDEQALAVRLLDSGVGAVVLTLGARGVLVADPDGVRPVPAPAAVPVDVTGAGDALVAGTLAALIGGAGLEQAAAAGVWRAARTVESPLSVLPRAAS